MIVSLFRVVSVRSELSPRPSAATCWCMCGVDADVGVGRGGVVDVVGVAVMWSLWRRPTWMSTPFLFLNFFPQIAQTVECTPIGDLVSAVCSTPEASGENKAEFGSQSCSPIEAASGFLDVSVPSIGRLHQNRCPLNSRHSVQTASKDDGKHTRSRKRTAEKDEDSIANPDERGRKPSVKKAVKHRSRRVKLHAIVNRCYSV